MFPSLPFDEQRNEVSDRAAVVLAVVHGHNSLDGFGWYVRELVADSVNDHRKGFSLDVVRHDLIAQRQASRDKRAKVLVRASMPVGTRGQGWPEAIASLP